MFGIAPLMPAFGRDYKSKKAAQADFDALKDFRSAGGQYVNKTDIIGMKGTGQRIECRSADKRKVWMLKT